jgi:hypothetical protein
VSLMADQLHLVVCHFLDLVLLDITEKA